MEREDKLKQVSWGAMRGDACSHNQYVPREKMTVRELCEYILTTGEWGYIGIKRDNSSIFGNPQIEYWKGNYCDRDRNPIELNFPEDILNSYVRLIDWDGGWGRGDWLFTLEGQDEELEDDYYDEEEEEEDELTPDEKIEQRIKGMTNEELERYILEAQARKLMKEEK